MTFPISIRASLFSVAWLFIISAEAQSPLQNVLTMGFGDIAEIKNRAEAGDPAAQVSLGDSLAHHYQPSDALSWYRKAAEQGNVDGEFHVGNMLLYGAPCIHPEFAVTANPVAGLRWTFLAATNFQASAMWNMSEACRQGLGTSIDLISSYAWLKLFSETPSGSILGRVHMNEMALKMTTADLDRAQRLAVDFKSGQWQRPIVRVIQDNDPRLKLNGLAFGLKEPLAIINGKTFSEGESGKVNLKPGTLTLKCIRIEKDSVLISIEGEDQRRILLLAR